MAFPLSKVTLVHMDGHLSPFLGSSYVQKQTEKKHSKGKKMP